jgi:hypothetical protein
MSNQKIFLTFFILSIFYKYISCKLDSSKVIAAINCGGDEYIDNNGVKYEADKYFNGGTPSEHGLNFNIKNTDDEILYQTERWSSETLTYSLPLKSNINGKYVLILKFSEVYFNSKGEKIFNVALGKETIIRNLDIYGKVGKAEAYDEYVEFEIRNKQVYFKNKSCNKALDGDKLVVNFKKGSADNPKVNAILLVKGNLKDTDYTEKKKKEEENKKKKMKMLKKEELINLRHDADELYDEEQLNDENFTIKKDTGFFSIFSSPLGIYIGGSLVLFAILNYLINKVF